MIRSSVDEAIKMYTVTSHVRLRLRNFGKHIILLGNRFSQNNIRSLKVANCSSMEFSIVKSVA